MNAHRALDVVVVEDDPATRTILASSVRELGHRCRSAADAGEAWRLLGESSADVVVSDWNMPGESGVDLCRRARAADGDERYTYFVLMTGAYDRARLLEAMDAGADDFQRKPIDLDELEAKLVSAGRVVSLHRRLCERTQSLRQDSLLSWRAARTDALTGAGNRLQLDEELAALASRGARYGRRCSIAMCDVDWFKAYNDRYGHLAGDEALRRVADAMRGHLRAGDALFRYGGEELLVVLHEQSLGDAAIAMERVRREVERLAIPAGRGGGPLTISVGVSELDPAASPSEWLARADAALYRAKGAGRNRVETD
jgi:two-component system chemotaxis response regulator CheY